MPSSHFNVSGNDYLTLLVSTCVRLMEFGIHEEGSSQTINQSEESTIRASSVKLLQLILKHGKHIDQVNRLIIPLSELGKRFGSNSTLKVLFHLNVSIESRDAVFQIELLDFMYLVLYQLDLKRMESPIIKSDQFVKILMNGFKASYEAQEKSEMFSLSLLDHWMNSFLSYLPFMMDILPSIITSSGKRE
jgi:hypothetical protein